MSWYEAPGWPYVRVDGSTAIVGASDCEGAAEAIRNLVDARLAETYGVSPVRINGTFVADAVSLEFDVTFELMDPIYLDDLRGTFVAVEDMVDGEDHYPRVSRAIHYEDVTLVNPGDEDYFNITIPCDAAWNPDAMQGIVFLQVTTDPKPVIQARVLPDPSAVEPIDGSVLAAISRIESIYPNPCAGSTEIRFNLSDVASAGDARLEIFDLAGRKISSLLSGEAGPGEHIRSWQGQTDHGEPLREGIYFVRLHTRDGIDNQKLVYLK